MRSLEKVLQHVVLSGLPSLEDRLGRRGRAPAERSQRQRPFVASYLPVHNRQSAYRRNLETPAQISNRDTRTGTRVGCSSGLLGVSE